MRLAPDPRLPADSARLLQRLNDVIGQIARQVNGVSEGTAAAIHNARTAAPTTGTWGLGDFLRNATPSGGAPVFGWLCVAAGTPGTWVALSASGGGGAGSVTSVNITPPAAGLTASGGPITTSGAITLGLANDLAALEGLGSTGFAQRTATDTWTTKALVLSRGASWGGGGVAMVLPTNDVVVSCPTAGTITKATLLGVGGPGSCVVNVFKCAAGAYPTVSSICASSKPTLSAGFSVVNSTLSGWTTAIAAGDVLVFRLESTSTFTGLSLVLDIAP
jgi:hypothetical protein